MSHQIWIICPKSKTQDLKSSLGKKVCRAQKVRKASVPDHVMVPTTEYRDEYQDAENTAAFADKFFHQTLGAELSPLRSYISLVLMPKVTVEASQSPIEVAVSTWLLSLPQELLQQEPLLLGDTVLRHVPKRWSVYHPMVLLPTGSFQDEYWKALLDRVRLRSRGYLDRLWEAILGGVEEVEGKGREGGRRLTHLAVNAAIPLQNKLPKDFNTISKGSNNPDSTSNQVQESVTQLNFLRSPSGLIMLYGDFGPTISEPEDTCKSTPTTRDFKEAFWVSTYQNGIYQTWAPRYTMFSRGNIKEKARILHFHNDKTLSSKVSLRRTAIKRSRLHKSAAVDMYAGIGYFVFSYIKMGIGRVVCFEINPWSVEGLRRGAEKNGWKIKVMSSEEICDLRSGRKTINDILSNDVRIIVFQESNTNALDRISLLENDDGTLSKQLSPQAGDTESEGFVWGKDVLHVNCGLLPSSKDSWDGALALVRSSGGSWLHLHENLVLEGIEGKRGEIEEFLRCRTGGEVEVEHVELVKTFAPGVWHCVFDVYVHGLEVSAI